MKLIRFGLLCILLLLTSCSAYSEIDPNYSETIADFTFVTQDEEPLSLQDLEGKWWIADFIFTNCVSVCMPMTYHMSLLQDKLKEHELDIQLISFSVDPDYDSPEVLRQYAQDYGADLSNWSFLTGYDFQTIRELAIKSFRTLVKAPERGSDQVMHGTEFLLVSPEGKMIKSYDGLDAEEIDRIIEDLKLLKQNGKL